jgi:hypothetical protein
MSSVAIRGGIRPSRDLVLELSMDAFEQGVTALAIHGVGDVSVKV